MVAVFGDGLYLVMCFIYDGGCICDGCCICDGGCICD